MGAATDIPRADNNGGTPMLVVCQKGHRLLEGPPTGRAAACFFCFRSFAPCLRSRGSAGRPARWNSLRIFRAGCCAAERFRTRAKPHVCLRLCALREGGSQAAAREDSNGSDELEEEAEEGAEEEAEESA